MRVPRFMVRNQRSIVYAECANVPRLMLIAGPNGAGKSTLLNAIRTVSGNNQIMYVGPHRAMRRQQVQQRHLFTAPISYETLLSSVGNVPMYEGIRLVDGARDAWSYDESANYLKHALCQLETERQQAISERFDRLGEITRDSLVDPWQPLRTLANNLLPHLSFVKIDTGNRDQVRCLWRVHNSATLVDLDDLSSGEKSIIQMFYPLVERQTRALLNQIRTSAAAGQVNPLCVLIDEPELHLHPNLQLKVLDYLRLLTLEDRLQVILATHSPTMVEYATFNELFLLRPAELISHGDNQLLQIADNEERLKVLHDVFGTASNITSMQPIIVVEGSAERQASQVVADRKLYRALHPGFDSVSLIPGGGKSECQKLLGTLTTALGSFSGQLKAFALLDRDYDDPCQPQSTFLLPAAMIENLLIDSTAMWEAMQSVVEKTPFKSPADVQSAISAVLDTMYDDEVVRRVLANYGVVFFRPAAPLDEIPEQANQFLTEMQSRYSDESVARLLSAAKQEVEMLTSGGHREKLFHGKKFMSLFFSKYLHSTGISKNVFLFETARHARRRDINKKFFDELFGTIAAAKGPSGH